MKKVINLNQTKNAINRHYYEAERLRSLYNRKKITREVAIKLYKCYLNQTLGINLK